MSELRFGRFHHLAESRTCGYCGNALGTYDHEEACSPPPATSSTEDLLTALGLSKEKVRAIGGDILERADESGSRLAEWLK